MSRRATLTPLVVSAICVASSATARIGSVVQELARCLADLRTSEEPKEPVFSPCSGQEGVKVLVGKPCGSIEKALGKPTWSNRDGASYQFYRFPRDGLYAGGGAILDLRFDSTD